MFKLPELVSCPQPALDRMVSALVCSACEVPHGTGSPAADTTVTHTACRPPGHSLSKFLCLFFCRLSSLTLTGKGKREGGQERDEQGSQRSGLAAVGPPTWSAGAKPSAPSQSLQF